MKPNHTVSIVVGLAALTFSMITFAAENDAANAASIKKAFEERFPDQKVVHVMPSAIAGLYEVFTGTRILYSDKTAEHIVTGSLIETRTKEDLTSARVDELNRIDFQTLPLDRAIKIVKGDGTRQLAVFSDPDCPYCKRLEQELASITNVTIYTFLYPLPIHPNAAAKSQAIWCAPDRAAAWTQWMLHGKEPESRSCEGNPTGELVELGKKLHITGTPTLYFSTGRRMSGGRPAKELAELLDK